MIGSPTAMPASATTIGRTIASTEPNAMQQDDDRGDEPDALARQRRPLRLLDELTAEPHFELRCRVLLREVDHLLADGVGNVLRLRVELRVGQRDRARLRDATRRRERIAHARRRAGLRSNSAMNVFACCLHRGVGHRRRPLHHHLHGVARLRLEVRGKEVRRARRLGVGRAEVGGEVRARDRREHVDADRARRARYRRRDGGGGSKSGRGREATWGMASGRRNERARLGATIVRKPDYTRVRACSPYRQRAPR